MAEWFPEVRHGTALYAAGYRRGWLISGWFRAIGMAVCISRAVVRSIPMWMFAVAGVLFIVSEAYRSAAIRCPKCRALWSSPFRLRPATFTEDLMKCPRCEFSALTHV